MEGAVEDRASVERALVGRDGRRARRVGLVKAKGLDDFMRVNLGGTENLVQAALKQRETVRRFVLVSSLAALRPSDASGTPIPEDAEPRPVTHYGKSKLAAERAALAQERRALTIVLRPPPAIYGPRDREILAFFKSIKIGLLPLLGSTQ